MTRHLTVFERENEKIARENCVFISSGWPFTNPCFVKVYGKKSYVFIAKDLSQITDFGPNSAISLNMWPSSAISLNKIQRLNLKCIPFETVKTRPFFPTPSKRCATKCEITCDYYYPKPPYSPIESVLFVPLLQRGLNMQYYRKGQKVAIYYEKLKRYIIVTVDNFEPAGVFRKITPTTKIRVRAKTNSKLKFQGPSRYQQYLVIRTIKSIQKKERYEFMVESYMTQLKLGLNI